MYNVYNLKKRNKGEGNEGGRNEDRRKTIMGQELWISQLYENKQNGGGGGRRGSNNIIITGCLAHHDQEGIMVNHVKGIVYPLIPLLTLCHGCQKLPNGIIYFMGS